MDISCTVEMRGYPGLNVRFDRVALLQPRSKRKRAERIFPDQGTQKLKETVKQYLAAGTKIICVGIPHSLGQTLGALKDTPHGESCAACLIPTVQWTLPEGEQRLARVAEILSPDLRALGTTEKSSKTPELLAPLLSDIGLTATFGNLGLKETEISQLVDVAFDNYGRGMPRWIKPGDRESMAEIARASL